MPGIHGADHPVPLQLPTVPSPPGLPTVPSRPSVLHACAGAEATTQGHRPGPPRRVAGASGPGEGWASGGVVFTAAELGGPCLSAGWGWQGAGHPAWTAPAQRASMMRACFSLSFLHQAVPLASGPQVLQPASPPRPPASHSRPPPLPTAPMAPALPQRGLRASPPTCSETVASPVRAAQLRHLRLCVRVPGTRSGRRGPALLCLAVPRVMQTTRPRVSLVIYGFRKASSEHSLFSRCSSNTLVKRSERNPFGGHRTPGFRICRRDARAAHGTRSVPRSGRLHLNNWKRSGSPASWLLWDPDSRPCHPLSCPRSGGGIGLSSAGLWRLEPPAVGAPHPPPPGLRALRHCTPSQRLEGTRADHPCKRNPKDQIPPSVTPSPPAFK